MDDTTGTATDEAAGCEACTTWSGDFIEAFKRERGRIVASSFHLPFEYFDAYLVQCDRCSTTWLGGYIEDFSERDVYAEWGDRWWTMRALTPELLAQIDAADGTGSLDLKTFAADRPGSTWTQ